jgi:heterodisulfide reductase subunit A2
MLTNLKQTLTETKRIAVIGAGPAGLAAVASIAALGIAVDWFDKEDSPGGKLKDYHQLFPARVPSDQVLEDLVMTSDAIRIKKHFGVTITRIEKENGQFLLLSNEKILGSADAVILATGFDFFDARLKEEFGYGIYNQVITSPDLERILKADPDFLRRDGKDPESIAFVHCVGSRDQQIGINYCSRLCCITGIKQAIEMKELFPTCQVVNFYIDIRAFGSGYEELYRDAQEKYKVRFIRGRVSEASENQQKRIVLKAEDTLMARPLKFTVDWLVLLVGMVPSCSPVEVNNHRCRDPYSGFYNQKNSLISSALDGESGVFVAGSSGGPMSIPEATASGRSVAMEAVDYVVNR